MSSLVAEGESPPRISLSASRTDPPVYTRFMNSGGRDAAVLTGLGPGTFRVRAYPVMRGFGGSGPRPGLDETLELDGRSTVELTLDLRE